VAFDWLASTTALAEDFWPLHPVPRMGHRWRQWRPATVPSRPRRSSRVGGAGKSLC
jgi:hypothetical protein